MSTLIRGFYCSLALASVFALPAVAQRQRNADRPNRTPDKLAEGDAAPDFTLKSLDGKTTTKLSSFRGKKPVALVFGSYT